VIRRLTRFLALPAAEQGRTVEAASLLLVVRLVLGLMPFRWALMLLRVSSGHAGAGRISAAEARDVSRAIARAARYAPFRAVCLQQAFAALLMLRRRGLAATVHLGVAREASGSDLRAHAWSRCGDVPVTGEAAARDFTPVAAFAA
jgi:Transglutaminase-like superfamily